MSKQNKNKEVIQKKKITTLIRSGVVIFGIGAGAIFGKGLLASQTMAANIDTEPLSIIPTQNVAIQVQDESIDKVSKAVYPASHGQKRKGTKVGYNDTEAIVLSLHKPTKKTQTGYLKIRIPIP